MQIQRHVTNKSAGKANTTDKRAGKANTANNSAGKANTTNKSAEKANSTNKSAGKATLTMQRGANTNIIGPLLSGQHFVNIRPTAFNLRSDFVNVWRHARLVVYIMYAYLMGSWCFCFDRVLICLMIWRFVPWSCLAFLIIPRLIQTRRCHCPRLKDVLKFQASSCSAG